MASEPRRPSMHHDWHSKTYVADWIVHDTARDPERRPRLQSMLAAAPLPRDAAIEVLDVGAGYGAVTEEVLKAFPQARVTLQDYSTPMLGEARRRLAGHAAQLRYVTADLTDPGWAQKVGGPFDLAVSANRVAQSARPAEDLRLLSRDPRSAAAGGLVSRLRSVLHRGRGAHRRTAEGRLRRGRMPLAGAAPRHPRRRADRAVDHRRGQPRVASADGFLHKVGWKAPC
jgi:SAM-dependent methyltransferase